MKTIEEYNTDESKLVLQLEELRETASVFDTKGWKFLQKATSDVEQMLVAEFLGCKESNHMFHIQGRLQGIRTIIDLPTVITNTAQEIQTTLEAIRKEKQELINNG